MGTSTWTLPGTENYFICLARQDSSLFRNKHIAGGGGGGGGCYLCKNKYLLWLLSLSVVYSKQSLFCPGSRSGDRQQKVMDQPRFCILQPQNCISSNNPWLIGGSLIFPAHPLWTFVISLKLSLNVSFFSSCAQYQFRNKMKFSCIQLPLWPYVIQHQCFFTEIFTPR